MGCEFVKMIKMMIKMKLLIDEIKSGSALSLRFVLYESILRLCSKSRARLLSPTTKNK